MQKVTAAQNIRLIDYEKICDSKGTRLVRFGKFAGYAGMIDMLRILGERLLVLGYSTPFLVRNAFSKYIWRVRKKSFYDFPDSCSWRN